MSTFRFGPIWRQGIAGLALSLAAAALPAVAAQQDDEDEDAPIARPVVQTVVGSARLNGALARLANNPRDMAALLDAGQAALDMNDLDAAIGFFRRADGLSPGNAAVKAGLAGALVRKLDPFSAIPLFEEAARGGTLGANALADRGLAYDLVGDAVSAQRYYRLSLAAGHNDDTVRRLALSQAIDGDRSGMEATLSPLLQKQDRMAWRTRSFALAVLGRGDEAESIARSTMPADLAVAMSAYLRYMPRLTRAQQAAAGDLGYFPRAADIGRDDPRVAQFVNRRPELVAANQALTPAGRPMGKDARDKDRRDDKKAKAPVAIAQAAPPEIKPAREEIKPAASPPPVMSKPAATVALAVPKPTPAPAPAVTTAAGPGPDRVYAVPPPVVPPASAPASPGFDLAKLGQPASSPTPMAARAPAKRSLADAFADLAAPSGESAPVAGAVDMTRLPAAKSAAKLAAAKPSGASTAKTKAEIDKKAKAEAEKAKADADKKAKANPARIWVQVRTGRDRKALGFDWRKLVKDDPAAFKGKSPYVVEWNATNRLVTGPFATDKAAAIFMVQLKKAGVGGAFLFHSEAGEEVDQLGGR